MPKKTRKSVTKKNNMTPKYRTTGTVVKKNRGTKLTKIKKKFLQKKP